MSINVRPYKPTEEKDYRVGGSVATLLRLRDLQVPPPDQVIYKPYTESYVRADGSRVGDGLPSIEWIWDIISVQQISRVENIFFSTETLAYVDTVFIRSDKRLGYVADPTGTFANFQVTVWKPELFGPDGTPVSRSSYGIQTVKLSYTNLVAV